MDACSVRVLMKNIGRAEKTDLTRRNLPSYESIVEHPDSLLLTNGDKIYHLESVGTER